MKKLAGSQEMSTTDSQIQPQMLQYCKIPMCYLSNSLNCDHQCGYLSTRMQLTNVHLAAYLIITTFLWQANIQMLLCSSPKNISADLCTCPRQPKCYSSHSYKVTSLEQILSIRNKITSRQALTTLTSATNH